MKKRKSKTKLKKHRKVIRYKVAKRKGGGPTIGFLIVRDTHKPPPLPDQEEKKER